MRSVNGKQQTRTHERTQCRYIRQLLDDVSGEPSGVKLTDNLCMEIFDKIMLPRVRVRRLDGIERRTTKPVTRVGDSFASMLVLKLLCKHPKRKCNNNVATNKRKKATRGTHPGGVDNHTCFVVQTVKENGMKLHLSRSDKVCEQDENQTLVGNSKPEPMDTTGDEMLRNIKHRSLSSHQLSELNTPASQNESVPVHENLCMSPLCCPDVLPSRPDTERNMSQDTFVHTNLGDHQTTSTSPVGSFRDDTAHDTHEGLKSIEVHIVNIPDVCIRTHNKETREDTISTINHKETGGLPHQEVEMIETDHSGLDPKDWMLGEGGDSGEQLDTLPRDSTGRHSLPNKSIINESVQTGVSTRNENFHSAMESGVLDLSYKPIQNADIRQDRENSRSMIDRNSRNQGPPLGQTESDSVGSLLHISENTSAQIVPQAALQALETKHPANWKVTNYHEGSPNPYSPTDMIREHNDDRGITHQVQPTVKPCTKATNDFETLHFERENESKTSLSRSTNWKQGLVDVIVTERPTRGIPSAESRRRQRHYHHWGQPNSLRLNDIAEEGRGERQNMLRNTQVPYFSMDVSSVNVEGSNRTRRPQANQHEVHKIRTPANNLELNSKVVPETCTPTVGFTQTQKYGFEVNSSKNRREALEKVPMQRGLPSEPVNHQYNILPVISDQNMSTTVSHQRAEVTGPVLTPSRNQVTSTLQEPGMTLVPHFHTFIPQQRIGDKINLSTAQVQAFQKLQHLTNRIHATTTPKRAKVHVAGTADYITKHPSTGIQRRFSSDILSDVNQLGDVFIQSDSSASGDAHFPYQTNQHQGHNSSPCATEEYISAGTLKASPGQEQMNTLPSEESVVDPYGRTMMGCSACGGIPMFVCNGCHRTVYCSPRCQLKTWGEHFRVCQMSRLPL